ncbi:MAG: DUF454 domain-containing protein [Bacteroidetes bacterium HGW-Bacteroidetes-20]|nr:MAG: DUF454 domain-containing protein [Bacteroidetes bacterium HGW-Bacteroidetes-20]
MQYFLIFLGTISLGFGILGIFIPGLPTTPFLLLTASLYLRSSQKLYQKLIANKYLGKYIIRFNEEKGITKIGKIYSISIMWLMITLSVLFLIQLLIVKIIVISVGIIGTIVMGFLLKTIK